MPTYIASFGNVIRISNPKNDKTAVKIKALNTEMLPFAIGLFFVLRTCLSMSLSMISFTTQPAPRIIMLPKKNNTRKKVGTLYCDARSKPKLAGQNSKKKPVG